MNWKRIFVCAVLAVPAPAQSNEVGLTLGRLIRRERGPLEIGGGTAWQANYGRRLLSGSAVKLYVEVHLLANPLREIAADDARATRDTATLYVTPGLRVKFLPQGRVQPYAAAGGGYALYENSTTTLGGAANPAPRFQHTGAFTVGGGIDIPLRRWLGVRFEVRDFYTPNPVFNIPVDGRRQHNVVAGGGFALRF